MITMKEIGQLAGVSQTAVSMIINGKAEQNGLSPKTQEKVLRIALEHDFHPNLLARSVRTGRTGIIGLIVSEASMRQIAASQTDLGHTIQFQAEFLLQGNNVMLEAVSDEDCNRLKMPRLLTSGLAESIIVCQNFNDEQCGYLYIKKLYEKLKRVILLDDFINDLIPTIAIDDIQVARDAADYLWSLGHRRFGMISCEDNRAVLDRRLAAFRQRISELSAGRISVAAALAGNRWQIDCGGLAVARLLSETTMPTAIFAGNDFFAYGAELELLKRGIRIPRDISLVGVGDCLLAENAPVPITAFAMKIHEKIAVAADIIHRFQCNEPLEQNMFLLRGGLVKRKSVSKVKDVEFDS